MDPTDALADTRDQNPNAQHDALTAAGCVQLFIDKASGKLARRPELDKALLGARDGDQLVIIKLDRLGRSLEHLIDLSAQVQQRHVDLVVLDQGIDTSTAVGRMFFQILGAIAEFEHALMSERTIDGLAAARARGRTGGQRKPKLTPRQAKIAPATDGVLVDLAAVTFLDCTGVTALLTGRRSVAARDVSYQAIDAGGIVLRVLQILGLDTVLNTEPHVRPPHP